jgi:hypothetical protein
MALDEYRRKRDFQKTSEPAPRRINSVTSGRSMNEIAGSKASRPRKKR